MMDSCRPCLSDGSRALCCTLSSMGFRHVRDGRDVCSYSRRFETIEKTRPGENKLDVTLLLDAFRFFFFFLLSRDFYFRAFSFSRSPSVPNVSVFFFLAHYKTLVLFQRTKAGNFFLRLSKHRRRRLPSESTNINIVRRTFPVFAYITNRIIPRAYCVTVNGVHKLFYVSEIRKRIERNEQRRERLLLDDAQTYTNSVLRTFKRKPRRLFYLGNGYYLP